jgi:hypothetical protein
LAKVLNDFRETERKHKWRNIMANVLQGVELAGTRDRRGNTA